MIDRNVTKETKRHGGGAPSLAELTTRSVVWAFCTVGASKLISLVGLTILARLLVPEDFGLFAFGLIVVTYVETVGDLGTGAALIYVSSPRARAAQMTFIINVAASGIATALAWRLAPTVAHFFHSAQAVDVLRALSWCFPLRALGNTHDALLRKDMKFRLRIVPEIGMTLTKLGLSLILAVSGFGVWSLVCGQLGGLAAWSLALWLLVDWRPNWSLPVEQWRPLLSYGRGIVAVNALAAVVHHVDFIIVGRALGAASLGFYQMAYKFPEAAIALVVWTVSKVLFPAFARAQHDLRLLRDSYLAALKYVSLSTVPVTLTLIILAEPLVIHILGRSWSESIPLLRALAAAIGLRALGAPAGDVLKATGRSHLLAKLGLLKAAVLTPALILAANAGAVAVAVTVASVTALTAGIDVAVVCRLTGIHFPRILDALRTTVTSSAVLVAALLLGSSVWRFAESPAAMLGCLVLTVGAYLTTVALVSPATCAEARRSLGRPQGALWLAGPRVVKTEE
jgi:O-antigen/teichoic acid export membrane protein